MLLVAHKLAKSIRTKMCCDESVILIWTLVQRGSGD